MFNRKHLSLIFMGLFLFAFVTESYSQRRSSRSSRSNRDDAREVRESYSFKDKLAYDILIGNLNFYQGLSASGKVGVGYKVLDPVTVGLGVTAYYQKANYQGVVNDISNTGYGFFPYLRCKIVESFYAKVEYDFFNFKQSAYNADDYKIDFNFPMVGGGYVSGFGKWKVGIELMFMVNDQLIEGTQYEKSDFYTEFDYNISFLYNF